jgi:hypothetical protein
MAPLNINVLRLFLRDCYQKIGDCAIPFPVIPQAAQTGAGAAMRDRGGGAMKRGKNGK